MPKFAFLVNDSGYDKYTYAAALSGGASVPRFGNKYIKKLYEIHNAEPLNRYFELPFKNIWFKRVVDEKKLDSSEEIYFVLYESFHMSYSRKFIRYYKRKYINSKFIYIFTNPAGSYNLGRLNKIRDLLDGVFTFSKEDAEKYGFLFLEAYPFSLPMQDDYEPETDVFFVGADKGRLPFILDIYEKLSAKGLKCDFWITDVQKDNQKYEGQIHYNHKLSYDEVLRHDTKTRCILEVLQDGKSYSSIRTLEAIQYKKKVLTMSDSVKDRWFYDSEIIFTFQDADDIPISFVKKQVDEKRYECMDFGSFDLFSKYVVNEMNKNSASRQFKDKYSVGTQ